MEKIESLLEDLFNKEEFIHGVVSNPRKKDKSTYNKIDIKPVLIRGELVYQFTYEYESKVLHDNLSKKEAMEKILEELDNFRQFMVFSKSNDHQILISKKGRVKIINHKPTKKMPDLSHNRKKEYILNEGEEIDFLIHLGVMTKNGRVVNKRYDKFRQINRFLELVEDIMPSLETNRTINIVDFGCGKSYLTFALYYYLVEVKSLDVNIVGLDLKKDVIDFCNQLAEELNYKDLTFIHKDIADYDGLDKVDMVVTLHACDNATDAALIKAVNWGAEVIMSVPCCQHELFDKIENKKLKPMLKHGIVRDKLTALVTDSLRGNMLEILGYEVQLLEFIDMEHTPKNILIRGVKNNKIDKKQAIKEYLDFKSMWNLDNLYIENNLPKNLKDW